jgi:chromatin remodeling complex protein RSC6
LSRVGSATAGSVNTLPGEFEMAAKKKSKKSAKKVAKKTRKPAKKAAKKAAKKKSGRKPNAAFMKPVQPNEKLAAVVGGGAMPRTEITKKLWAYIKRNGLQDKKNRRMINADDKLKAIFGGKGQVNMFQMTALVSKNIKG